MKTIELAQTPGKSSNWSESFSSGFAEGEAARKRRGSIPVYIRVAIDEYAEGFRAGFYGRQVEKLHIQQRFTNSVHAARSAAQAVLKVVPAV